MNEVIIETSEEGLDIKRAVDNHFLCHIDRDDDSYNATIKVLKALNVNHIVVGSEVE